MKFNTNRRVLNNVKCTKSIYLCEIIHIYKLNVNIIFGKCLQKERRGEVRCKSFRAVFVIQYLCAYFVLRVRNKISAHTHTHTQCHFNTFPMYKFANKFLFIYRSMCFTFTAFCKITAEKCTSNRFAHRILNFNCNSLKKNEKKTD